MSRDEREAFLAGLHIGVLAVERADGPPATAPLWYAYEPGGVVEMVVGREGVKGRLLRATGRASLCVQQEALPYAYVTVEGPVELDEADHEERRDAIARRYLGELAEGYLASTKDEDTVLARLTPERWRTTDYGKL
jgi:PPOX class probable F420-dependent enzyme